MAFLILWSIKQTWTIGKEKGGQILLGEKKKVKYCWKISTIAIRISTYPAFDHDLLPKLTRETRRQVTETLPDRFKKLYPNVIEDKNELIIKAIHFVFLQPQPKDPRCYQKINTKHQILQTLKKK